MTNRDNNINKYRQILRNSGFDEHEIEGIINSALLINKVEGKSFSEIFKYYKSPPSVKRYYLKTLEDGSKVWVDS